MSTRRESAFGFTALLALASRGCRQPARSEDADRGVSTQSGPSGSAQAASMTVYRDPGCGCCEEWAERARDAGYRVEVTDDTDMPAIKRRFGVPDELASCHTTVASGYVIEGHVPLEDVRRLLAARPAQTKGIAVPRMPLGSPGMESPDGHRQPFEVFAFDAAGRVTRFKV